MAFTNLNKSTDDLLKATFELVDTPTRLLEKPKDNVVRRLIAPMYVLSKDASLISARGNV